MSAPTPGDWRAVTFREPSTHASGDSLIDHALFRYAGNYEHYGMHDAGAVHIESASPEVIHSTFENNAWYALSADMRSYPTVSGNVLLNNGGNGLEVRGSDTGDGSGIWNNTDIAYVVTGNVVVKNPSVLLIEAGVVVKFTQWQGLFVDGTLRVQGTADALVVFTSWKDDEYGGDSNNDGAMSAPTPGDWQAVTFREPSTHASGDSLIDHALFRYAGNYEHYGMHDVGTVHIESASPEVIHSTFENNAWYALSADMRSYPTVSGNVLLNNGGNGLEVRGSDTGDGSGIWNNTDIAYVVTGNVVVKNPSVLLIEAGVVVKFTQWQGLFVDGTLRVQGTADALVVFTSWKDDEYGGDSNNDGAMSAPTPGDWQAVTFREPSTHASGDSLIDHALFRYAGNYEHYGMHDVGAVHVEAGSPTISNSIITLSVYGVWQGENASPVLTNNNIEGNVKEDVQQQS